LEKLDLQNSIRKIEFPDPQVFACFLEHNPDFSVGHIIYSIELKFFVVYSYMLLVENKILKEKKV